MDTEVKEKTQVEKIEDSIKNYKYAHETKFSKFSKLGNWMEKQSTIFKNESDKKKSNKPNFKRGEIIKVDFGVNMGSELCNTHFAIVLNSDDNNSVDNITVLPLTSKKGYKRIDLGNQLKPFINDKRYNKNSYALITQITTISKNKVFEDNIKCYCDEKSMKLINKEIINYLTK